MSQTFDADNRLLTHNGETVTIDADGNLTAIAAGVSPASYGYDVRNRLTSAGTLTYTYDAENRHVAQTDGTNPTTYVINPNAALDQVLMKTVGGVTTYYIYDLGLLHEETGGVVRYYHFDRRGDTVLLTNNSATVTGTAAYGVYGEMVSSSGTLATPFLFNGRWGVQTDANGLYYHRARYYHPSLRRFLNQDVMLGSITNGASMNRFAYANGNPVSMIDPFGLMAQDGATSNWVSALLGPVQTLVDWLIGQKTGAAWRDALSQEWVSGPTGGLLPRNLANGMWDVVRRGQAIAPDMAANGMHAWHAGSNAYLVEQLGITGVPLIFVGGLFHESPLDWGSFMAEQNHQGTVNHLLDSMSDIVANTLGLGMGILLQENKSVETAIRYGNRVPGPGEPDPAFGGNGNYNGKPSTAWESTK